MVSGRFWVWDPCNYLRTLFADMKELTCVRSMACSIAAVPFIYQLGLSADPTCTYCLVPKEKTNLKGVPR